MSVEYLFRDWSAMPLIEKSISVSKVERHWMSAQEPAAIVYIYKMKKKLEVTAIDISPKQ
jgi:hypothetical protein